MYLLLLDILAPCYFMCTNYHTIAISIQVNLVQIINSIVSTCVNHIFVYFSTPNSLGNICVFLKIYGKGKVRITRKNRKRLRIFLLLSSLTDYKKSNPPTTTSFIFRLNLLYMMWDSENIYHPQERITWTSPSNYGILYGSHTVMHYGQKSFQKWLHPSCT